MNREAEYFAQHGIVTFPGAIPQATLMELESAFDDVFSGCYRSGIAPKFRTVEPQDIDGEMCRISFPHLADERFLKGFASLKIGELVSNVFGANAVQAWFIHALRKIPSTSKGAAIDYVGWHQDGQYTPQYFDGDFLTVWINLTDVTEADGPVHFISGSHKGPLLRQHEGSGFSHKDGFDNLRDKMKRATSVPWDERVHLAPKGSISIHHSRLIHGSPPSIATAPRKTVVLHTRSEQNPLNCAPKVQPRKEYSFSFQSGFECPVLWGDISLLR